MYLLGSQDTFTFGPTLKVSTMKMMKKTFGMLAVCLMCGATSLQAQEQNEGRPMPPEAISPEKAAEQMTELMNQELELTDKQYKKIYKLNLKEQENRASAMEGNGGQRPPMPPMGSSQDMGERRPPMMGEGGMGPGMGPRMGQQTPEELKEEAEAKEKKLKKILTEEQYAKWQTVREKLQKQQRAPRPPKKEETLSK